MSGASTRAELSNPDHGSQDLPPPAPQEDLVWKFMERYFDAMPINQNKKRSFHKFATESLQSVFHHAFPLVVHHGDTNTWHIFELNGVTLRKPLVREADGSVHRLLPVDAELRNLTCSSDTMCHMTYSVYVWPPASSSSSSKAAADDRLPGDSTSGNDDDDDDGSDQQQQPPTLERVKREGRLTHRVHVPSLRLLKLSVMTQSVLCHTADEPDPRTVPGDNGGYFVLKGHDKEIMTAERTVYNRACLFPIKEKPFTHQAQIRSDLPGRFQSTKTLYMVASKATKTSRRTLYVTHTVSSFAQEAAPANVPLVVWLRALAASRASSSPAAHAQQPMITDEEIYLRFRLVAGQRWNSVYEDVVHACLTHPAALQYRSRDLATARVGRAVSTGQNAGSASFAALRRAGRKYMEDMLLWHMGTATVPPCCGTGGAGAGSVALGAGFTSRLSESGVVQLLDNKAWALIDTACQLIDLIQNPSLKTDKDHYFNKRFEAPDDLLGMLLRQGLDRYLKKVHNQVLRRLNERKPVVVTEVFHDRDLTSSINDALATGIWHVTREKVVRTGYAQKRETTNLVTMQAQQTKIVKSLPKQGGQAAARMLSLSGYGTVCPADSPEGPQVGVSTHQALLEHHSLGTDPSTVTHLLHTGCNVLPLERLGVQFLASFVEQVNNNSTQLVIVRVNGTIVGVHRSAATVAEFVRTLRRKLAIDPDTSVHTYTWRPPKVNIRAAAAAAPAAKRRKTTTAAASAAPVVCRYEEVLIRTDVGRAMRPLLICANLHKLAAREPGARPQVDLDTYNWHQLLLEGIVEYVDKEEEDDLVIAQNGETFCRAPAEYSHMEIHGVAMYGVAASLVPFPDHNPAARITYTCQHFRAAQSYQPLQAKQHRMDISLMELWYPERPLVDTAMSRLLQFHRQPTGQNAMVAILVTGLPAQEDALLVNKAFIDRGGGRSMVSRVLTATEKRHGAKASQVETFRKMDPTKCVGRKPGSYTGIDADGLVGSGLRTQPQDIVVQRNIEIPPVTVGGGGGGIGAGAAGNKKNKRKHGTRKKKKKKTKSKTKNKLGTDGEEEEDDSLSSLESGSDCSGSDVDADDETATAATLRRGAQKQRTLSHRDISYSLPRGGSSGQESIIQEVMVTNLLDDSQLRMAKIRSSQMRVPTWGDKFTSRHGQKGTLGVIVPQEDMIFDEMTGLSPSYVFSGLSFVSRMTFGQFCEMLLSIIVCMTGQIGDGTPFSTNYREALYRSIEERLRHFKPRTGRRRTVDELCDALAFLGFQPQGERCMRSGTTGRLLNSRVFMGMTYIEKLKHMVHDKIRDRAEGKENTATGQPEEGRAKGGGLKIGEMERDGIAAHGAAANIRDRMLFSSDLRPLTVCRLCKRQSVYNERTQDVYCIGCKRYDTSHLIPASKAFRLMTQEVAAVSLDVRLEVKAERER